MSSDFFPQALTFLLSKSRPGVLKCFGWSCTKALHTNPGSVEVAASVDGKSYESVGRLVGRELAGEQVFPVKPVYLRFKYVKVTVLAACGASKVVVSRFFLYEDVPERRSSPETDLHTLLSQLPRSSTHPRISPPISQPIPDEISSLHDMIRNLTLQVQNLQSEVSQNHVKKDNSAVEFVRKWQETVLEPRLEQFERRIWRVIEQEKRGKGRYRDSDSALY